MSEAAAVVAVVAVEVDGSCSSSRSKSSSNSSSEVRKDNVLALPAVTVTVIDTVNVQLPANKKTKLYIYKLNG